MVKKKRIPGRKPGATSSSSPPGNDRPPAIDTPVTSKPATTTVAVTPLPPEVERGDWTVVMLALMIFLAPALGVPNEMMLQDTLKSMLVSFFAVAAGVLFFWQQRNRRDGLRWHAIMWLPLALMFYALGSMVWSHAYLGGVEAIRWFVFSLMLWLGMNTFSRQRTLYLFEGIHWG